MVLTAIYRLIFYLHQFKIIGGVEINGRESEGAPGFLVITYHLMILFNVQHFPINASP